MPLPRLALLVFLIPLLAVPGPPAAAFEEVNRSFFGGVAMGGYDAVGYFTESRALKGGKAHAVEWKGATWLFASAANRQRFQADPEAFAPRYGGHCSNQMSLGNLSDIDPEVWRIIDGRLYLFGHDEGRVRWETETGRRIGDADRHWRGYLGR